MNLTELITTIGYFGLVFIIFSESGLLFGVVFPGDSVLFTAGVLASQGVFNIWWLASLCFVAAVTGDSVGYAFGKRVGRKIFDRPNSFFFNQRNLARAEEFYARHGGKTIILARFIPAVRTLAPILAGVGRMVYRDFLFFNIVGALFWAVGLTWLGYFLGNSIPGIDAYILPVLVVIVIASVLPAVWHFIKKQN